MQILKHIFILMVLSVLTLSCDKIPLNEIEENIAPTVSTGNKVLLEYYTGHKCGNCPAIAGKSLSELKNTYGEDLVIMSIHAGFFASTNSSGDAFSYDFRTPAGNNLDTEFGVTVTGTPKGMINRAVYNNTNILTPTQWNAAINNVVTLNPKVLVEITSSLVADTSYTASLSIEIAENIDNPLQIAAYITEDSLVNWQRDYNLSPEDIPNYVHRYVLRKGIIVNNAQLGSNNFVAGFREQKDLSFKISSEYKPENCALVIVVFDPVSKNIIQVEEQKLGN